MPPEEPLKQEPLKQIRTYQGDMAEAIAEKKESLVSIRAEEKAHTKNIASDGASSQPGAKRNILATIVFFIASLVFIAAAGAAGWYAYHSYVIKTTVVPVAQAPANEFLPASLVETADASVLTREALISFVRGERQKTLADGNIEELELTMGSTTASSLQTTTQFWLSLNATPPGNLVRAFDPLYMLGILGTTDASSTNQTVLLIKLDSYENAYAGMLDWEANMAEDILPLFADDATIAAVPNNAAFTDVTINNKDARELKDANGKSVLIYTFYKQDLLVVTGSETALTTILAKLDAQAQKH